MYLHEAAQFYTIYHLEYIGISDSMASYIGTRYVSMLVLLLCRKHDCTDFREINQRGLEYTIVYRTEKFGLRNTSV